MGRKRRTFLRNTASIGIAGLALGATTTVTASDVPPEVERTISLTNPNSEPVEYSVRLQSSDDPNYVDEKWPSGTIPGDDFVSYDFVGPIDYINLDGECNVSIGGYDTEKWQEDTDDQHMYPWLGNATGSGTCNIEYKMDYGGYPETGDDDGDWVQNNKEIDGWTPLDSPDPSEVRLITIEPDEGESISLY